MRSNALIGRVVGGAALLVLCAGASVASAQAIEVIAASQDHNTGPLSLVPGQGGARYSNFGRMTRTPTTNRWAVVTSTSVTPASQDQFFVVGNGAAVSVLAQEGVTAIRAGEFLNFSTTDLPVPRLNDAGQWATSVRLAPTSSNLSRVVRWNGTSFDFIAESQTPPVAGVPDYVFGWGVGLTNAGITQSGAVSFDASGFTPLFGTGQRAVVGANGATTFVRTLDTIPTGQAGGGTFPFTDLDVNSLSVSAAGDRWIVLGTLAGLTGNTRVAVVNNAVVAQTGSALAGSGFTSPVATISEGLMEPDGTWFLRGANADSIAWLLRDGVVIAASGQPITPGSSETWTTFIDVRGNNAGQFAIVGNTNNADTLRNSVIVLGGVPAPRVLVRESDGVDFTGDGTPDLFLGTLRERHVLLDDGFYYFAASLKLSATATTNVSGNRASLLRIATTTGPTCDTLDFNQDGDFPTPLDLEDFIAANAGSICSTCSTDLDFNNDGDFPTPLDIEAFISVNAGGPCL